MQIKCPHCYHLNAPFLTQRCEHCRLPMLSDQEFRIVEEIIREKADALEKKLGLLEAKGYDRKLFEEAADAFGELEPFVSKHVELLKENLYGYAERLKPFRLQAMSESKHTLNYIILALLTLIPLIAALMGANIWLWLPLSFPPLTWLMLIRGWLPWFRND